MNVGSEHLFMFCHLLFYGHLLAEIASFLGVLLVSVVFLDEQTESIESIIISID